jgi:uncharacterized protein YodC (DUF2158 family)
MVQASQYCQWFKQASTANGSSKPVLPMVQASQYCQWFKQASTANASINQPHLKEKALHVAAHLVLTVFRLQMAGSTVLKKNTTCDTRLSGQSAIVNPKTVMDWKHEELPKIINGYQPKDKFNVTKVILAMEEQNQSRGSLFC